MKGPLSSESSATPPFYSVLLAQLTMQECGDRRRLFEWVCFEHSNDDSHAEQHGSWSLCNAGAILCCHTFIV